MKPVRRDALRDQIIGEFIDHSLGVAKNNAQLESMKIHKAKKGLALVALRNLEIPLLDRRHRQSLLFDLHRLRLARMTLDQIANWLRHRRGEKHRLPLIRCRLQNVFDILAESHVEHAIRLVEDDHFHRFQPQGSALHVVHDSPRRANHDLDAFFQLMELPLIRCPAVDRHRVDAPFVGREFVHFIRDLHGEFAGGAHNQNLNHSVLRRTNFNRGYCKGSRLSRAGLRLADHIMALHQNRNCGTLNRRGLLEPQIRHRFQNLRRQAQVRKIQCVHLLSIQVRSPRVMSFAKEILVWWDSRFESIPRGGSPEGKKPEI